jgi:hypothetical protein
MMIRGVGDPLIAMYLRAYLARKGREIAPQLTEHLTTSFNDYLYTHQIVTQRYTSTTPHARVTSPPIAAVDRVSCVLVQTCFPEDA